MFHDVPSMYVYLEKLKETVDLTILQKKEMLNYKCEICKENAQKEDDRKDFIELIKLLLLEIEK